MSFKRVDSVIINNKEVKRGTKCTFRGDEAQVNGVYVHNWEDRQYANIKYKNAGTNYTWTAVHHVGLDSLTF